MPEMNIVLPLHDAAPPTALPSSLLRSSEPSPLMLCDRLIGLAQDADRAGFATTATRLLSLANRIFDEKRATG